MTSDGATATALALGGIAVMWGSWWAVTSRGRSIWRVMPWVLTSLAVAALIWGDVAWWGTPLVAVDADLGRSAARAAAAGIGAGLVLFVATRIALIPLSRWRRFDADTHRAYAEAGGRPLASMLALSFVSAAGEELFWRGWVQPAYVRGWTGDLRAALVVSLLVYVIANLPSRSLVIVAGSVVGGVTWVLLTAATGGVLAALMCHGVWTLAMIAWPRRGGAV